MTYPRAQDQDSAQAVWLRALEPCSLSCMASWPGEQSSVSWGQWSGSSKDGHSGNQAEDIRSVLRAAQKSGS